MGPVQILLIVLISCFSLNIPIAFTLGITSVITILFTEIVPMTMIPQRMMSGINSFPLLAIPFFMLAGSIMEAGGISKRIVTFASAIVGHIKGGLSAVSIIACVFFAALSGSAPATTAAIGSITVPEMKKRGYSPSYSAAVVASAGTLGVVIPPSITMVVFGVTANISIGRLLIGGILPGIFLGFLLLAVNFIMARIHDFPTEPKAPAKEVLRSFLDSGVALIMPIIILGGIMTGIFTPTESAAVAVVYGLLVGFLYYKELSVKKLIPIFFKASMNSSMIMILIAAANPFGWLLTRFQIPGMVGEFILSLSNNPSVIYALIMVLFLFLGTFMETAAIILLVVPILMPIINQMSFDPVHFGVVSVIALAIGMGTPPVGIALFAACGVSNVTMAEITRKVIPFLAVLILGLFILTYNPWIVTFLPNALM